MVCDTWYEKNATTYHVSRTTYHYMKIIFFGSDDFAAVHLEALLQTSHQMVACVTQPDKQKGRGMKVVFSPIKEIALKHKIPLFQPESFKDPTIIRDLQQFGADLFVVIAYGRILPQSVLDLPRKMAINVHGSLLPKYRGAAPINWAIINGDKETGISIIRMNVKMDAGEILAEEKLAILEADDAATLRQKMAQKGKNLLVKTIETIAQNSFSLKKQDERQVTLAPKLTKELGNISWQKSAVEIHRLIAGLQPWPRAFTFYKGKQLKLYSTRVIDEEFPGVCGQVLKLDKNGILVKTGKEALLIQEVQLEGSNKVTARQFMIGHRLEVGSILE